MTAPVVKVDVDPDDRTIGVRIFQQSEMPPPPFGTRLLMRIPERVTDGASRVTPFLFLAGTGIDVAARLTHRFEILGASIWIVTLAAFALSLSATGSHMIVRAIVLRAEADAVREAMRGAMGRLISDAVRAGIEGHDAPAPPKPH